MKLYKQLEKESFAELSSSEVSAVNVLTKMLRLSQMTGGYLTDDAGSITSVSTAKLDALSDILDTMLTEDRKLVIHGKICAGTERAFRNYWNKNRSAMRLYGAAFLTVQRKSADFRKMQNAVYLLGRSQRQDWALL